MDMYVRHFAGEYKDDKQHCVVCGEIICDYRNVGFLGAKPQGYPEGEVFVNPGNPRTTQTYLDYGDDYLDCSEPTVNQLMRYKYLLATVILLVGITWYIIDRTYKAFLVLLAMLWYFNYKRYRFEIFKTVSLPIGGGDMIEWDSSRDYFRDLFSFFQ